MQGCSNGPDGAGRGVIPRAAEQVFAHARDLSLIGWAFTFEVSFLEIYNEVHAPQLASPPPRGTQTHTASHTLSEAPADLLRD